MRISPHDPNIGYTHYRLSLANLLIGNTDEAIRWYEKAALTYYDLADAYLELGAALSLKGDKAMPRRHSPRLRTTFPITRRSPG